MAPPAPGTGVLKSAGGSGRRALLSRGGLVAGRALRGPSPPCGGVYGGWRLRLGRIGDPLWVTRGNGRPDNITGVATGSPKGSRQGMTNQPPLLFL